MGKIVVRCRILAFVSFVLILVQAITGQPPIADIYNTCGNDKTCFGHLAGKVGCVKSKNCEQMVTYVYNPTGARSVEDKEHVAEIRFQLYSNGSKKYAAFGFSNTNEMGEVYAVKCINTGVSVIVKLSLNVEKSKFQIADDLQLQVMNKKTKVEGNKTLCEFSLPPKIKITDDITVDLNRNKYYILIVGGNVVNGDAGNITGKAFSARKVSIIDVPREDIDKDNSKNSGSKNRATIKLFLVLGMYLMLLSSLLY